MDAHTLFVIFNCRSFERANLNYAGVIYQYINRAELITDKPHHLRHLSRVRDIARESGCARAAPSKVGKSPVQFFRIASTYRNVCAFFSEFSCHDEPEATRAASYQDCLSVEVVIVCSAEYCPCCQQGASAGNCEHQSVFSCLNHPSTFAQFCCRLMSKF